jgi:hypothetical protein
LLKAAANQPVSVAIDAGGSDFQFYLEVNYLTYLMWDNNICKSNHDSFNVCGSKLIRVAKFLEGKKKFEKKKIGILVELRAT